jgi:hypothetical protein
MFTPSGAKNKNWARQPGGGQQKPDSAAGQANVEENMMNSSTRAGPGKVHSSSTSAAGNANNTTLGATPAKAMPPVTGRQATYAKKEAGSATPGSTPQRGAPNNTNNAQVETPEKRLAALKHDVRCIMVPELGRQYVMGYIDTREGKNYYILEAGDVHRILREVPPLRPKLFDDLHAQIRNGEDLGKPDAAGLEFYEFEKRDVGVDTKQTEVIQGDNKTNNNKVGDIKGEVAQEDKANEGKNDEMTERESKNETVEVNKGDNNNDQIGGNKGQMTQEDNMDYGKKNDTNKEKESANEQPEDRKTC